MLEWGLEPFLRGKVIEPERMTFRRWQNGKPIGLTKLVPDFRKHFDAPYYVVHRADFHEAMHKLAVQLGVEIKVASRVTSYSAENATVDLQNGEKYSGDLVVAADGKPLDQKLLFNGLYLNASILLTFLRRKIPSPRDRDRRHRNRPGSDWLCCIQGNRRCRKNES